MSVPTIDTLFARLRQPHPVALGARVQQSGSVTRLVDVTVAPRGRTRIVDAASGRLLLVSDGRQALWTDAEGEQRDSEPVQRETLLRSMLEPVRLRWVARPHDADITGTVVGPAEVAGRQGWLLRYAPTSRARPPGLRDTGHGEIVVDLRLPILLQLRGPGAELRIVHVRELAAPDQALWRLPPGTTTPSRPGQ